MKKFSIINRLALLALSGAVLLAPQMAQPQTPGAPTHQPKGLPPEPRIDVNIKLGRLEWGGESKAATMGNVVQHLRDRIPDLDFVLSPGVTEIVVSNLTLRAADLRGTLEAIVFATGSQMQVCPLGKGNIYALSLHEEPRAKMSLEAFNLSLILDPLGPRDSDAVRQRVGEIREFITSTIWEFDDRTKQQRERPQISFHQATGLLVVVGHPEQLEIASKLAQALNAPVRSAGPAHVSGTPATPLRTSTQSKESPEIKKPSDARAPTP